MKKVSVIVPVYNVEKYISECLDSLVNQTLKDIEIIVVNDGSPDNSQSIIDEYVKKYPKLVKSYIKENGGLSSARNYGLEYAKGEYISFVDSDDWLNLDALEKMYNKANKEDSDIVICDMKDCFEDGTEEIYNCTKYNTVFEVTPSACNKLFKKSIIKDNSFLPGVWYEDLNFTTKILLNNPKISVISKPYYNCNCRYGSTMNNNNSLKNLDMLYVIEDIIKYAKENNYYEEYKVEIEFLIINHVLLTTINRVARQKSKDKSRVLKKIIKYCKENIPNYKSNKIYKALPLNKKIIIKLNYIGLYSLSKAILNIKSKLK